MIPKAFHSWRQSPFDPQSNIRILEPEISLVDSLVLLVYQKKYLSSGICFVGILWKDFVNQIPCSHSVEVTGYGIMGCVILTIGRISAFILCNWLIKTKCGFLCHAKCLVCSVLQCADIQCIRKISIFIYPSEFMAEKRVWFLCYP